MDKVLQPNPNTDYFNITGNALLAILLLFAPAILVSMAAGFIGGALNMPEVSGGAGSSINHILLVSLISFFISLFALYHIAINIADQHQGISFYQRLAIKTAKLNDMAKYASYAAIFWLFTTAIAYIFELPEEAFMLMFLEDDVSILLTFLVTVGCAPIIEELVMRGYLLQRFTANGLSVVTSVIVSAVLFSLLHIGQYGWQTLVQIIVLGIYLGWVRVNSKNTSMAILSHAVFNLMSLVALFSFGAV